MYNCTDDDSNRQHWYGRYSPDPFLSALQLASHSKLIVLVEDLFCWWGNWDIEMLRTCPRWNICSFNRLTLRLILEELIDILATFIIYRYLICVFWLFSFYVLFLMLLLLQSMLLGLLRRINHSSGLKLLCCFSFWALLESHTSL